MLYYLNYYYFEYLNTYKNILSFVDKEFSIFYFFILQLTEELEKLTVAVKEEKDKLKTKTRVVKLIANSKENIGKLKVIYVIILL